MRGTIRGITDHHRKRLTSEWEFCSTAPDSATSPTALAAAAPAWRSTHVPNTAAGSLRDRGEWSLSAPARRFDADDWWYRCRFAAAEAAADERLVLGFDGLAVVAEAWLNGEPLLTSDNMFRAHEVPLSGLAPQNELLLRFRSLDHSLTAKRPRPRWKAPMIENQQIRWFRTTVLGRTPGWSPPAAAVGPWRDVWIERRKAVELSNITVRAGLQGEQGLLDLGVDIEPLPGCSVVSATLILERADRRHVTPLTLDTSGRRAIGTLSIPDVEKWWPHTHGVPATYDTRIEIRVQRSGHEDVCTVDLAPIGFRSVEVTLHEGDFEVRINGERIFCRGACWTPLDIVSLRAARADYAQIIEQMRATGMNMLRIGGTMVYEDDALFELCDANGILVWQDLMFANMDYPDTDAAFVANVTEELTQQLERLLPHPCLAVICGNSEVEQQAAMWGTPRERWSPRLFHEIVPALLTQRRAGIPYWPSSAHGGAFPHQVNQGTTSYYGVGAYLRPLEDARRSEVRFATECLGFANIPEDDALAAMPQGLALRVHHPDWKLRAPRDLGAGWDFDDVRDFYLRELFAVDPLQLRYADHDRYLQLSRIVSGEVMAATFAEWRRARSLCNGALVWFLRDLWAGAGWGIIDALGEPKAALYALRRVLQPTLLSITDEGNNGLALHIVNEAATELAATLTLTLYRAGETVVTQGRRLIRVGARSALELLAAELLDGFHDLSYAYRFGPPSYDVAVAEISREDGAPLMHATYFPTGLAIRQTSDIGLKAVAVPTGNGYQLSIRSRAFARWITVRADGYRCDDQYFHIPPGTERVLSLQSKASGTQRALRGQVHAMNASAPAQIELSA